MTKADIENLARMIDSTKGCGQQSLCKIDITHNTRWRISDSRVENSLCVVEGALSDVDVVSPNGYRYRKGFWDKVLADERVRNMIYNRECLGTIEHPTDDDEYASTPYEKASHVVLSVTVKNGVPYGKFALLDNEKGRSIKALVDVGVPIGVSTRGVGDIKEDEISKYVDEDSYGLITWDFTRKPNFPVKMNAVSDSLVSNPMMANIIKKKAIKSNVELNDDFIQALYMLKNSLDKIL